MISDRILSMEGSATLKVAAKAKELTRQGFDVIDFSVGQPDFNTPEHIKNAAKKALDANKTGYTEISGIPDLKKSLIEKYKLKNLNYELNEVTVSSGGKQALYNIFQAILNPGDEVILVKPCWVSYIPQILLAGGVPVLVESFNGEGFTIPYDKIGEKLSDRTKCLVINYPNNPTGYYYKEDELVKLHDTICDRNILVISDEIYEHVLFDNKKFFSYANLSDRAKKQTLIVSGFSKSYSMTGWRIGYTLGNKEIIEAMNKIQGHVTTCATSFVQWAAVEALTQETDLIAKMKKTYEERRNLITSRLSKNRKILPVLPDGTFYYFILVNQLFGKKIKGEVIKNSVDFCEKLLTNELVGMVPGSGFEDDRFVRLSFATSDEKIEKGVARFLKFIDEIDG